MTSLGKSEPTALTGMIRILREAPLSMSALIWGIPVRALLTL